MEERKKLIGQIYEQDRKCEKLKAQYMWGTVALYFVLYFALCYIIFCYNIEVDLGEISAVIILPAMLAWLTYWVNYTIFSNTFSKIRKENDALKACIKRLEEYDKEHNIDMRNTVENRIIYGHM